ncbi:hypothetical protein TSUD_61800 [Trifolium subterraneum]|uniref:Uncharacterized protein n=1 Tax=Trifolium subterraneum TaxID=3900 RepID=A0A2Z6P3R6_TRISU|nr:hypothetical protein TSUD_61800 [Trifolium subterraneum]
MAFNNPFLMHHAVFLNTDAAKPNNKEHDNFIDDFFTAMRTYRMEFDAENVLANLPSLFTQEFGSQMHKYNILVNHYGNRFEVVLEKHNGVLCFTHGWSQISNCYVDNHGKGGWVSLTYIRPRLFVFILKDRCYENLIGRHIHNPAYFNLARELFGPDKYLEKVTRIALPYCHDESNFAHIFIVTLTPSDVASGFLLRFS